ncbi:unnamed protein product [Brassicogethes aeneus]|uniref:C2H2-type domain-containing protein n=1 Tax=Brassicogethes aeneus TaxID=1431903 RepID=A0A9P0FPQ6_BRAAE|nr:unnamed protein product [Brassicogethes aeneus]
MDQSGNRELLDHVVINDVGQTASQYIINNELLQTQHGLVVDISGSEFIPVNYSSEDLLSQDLTEEDRNLAAALVAVQLNHQQKHQQLQDNVGTTTALPSIVGGKILDDQQIILDKSGNNGYLHIVGSDNLYVEKQNLPKLVDNRSFTSKAGASTVVHSFTESSGITLSVKSEEEKKDSDGESVRNENRSSKKSLPHKKRISRKLKKNCAPNSKKITCNLCEQSFTSTDEFHQHEILCQTTITPVTPMSFNCQLCETPFTDQLRFFEHLKRHYEPPSAGGLGGAGKEPPHPKREKAEKKPPPPSPEPKAQRNRRSASPPASPPPASERSPSVDKKEPESLLSSLLCLTCMECNKTFRRQKTFEQHMRDVHSPKEELVNDEFSEPEDFMEGINVVVDNDPSSDFDDEGDEDSKAWYREEELHQTEEDLKEMEETNGHICHLCKQPFPLRAILLQHLVTCRVINHDLDVNQMEHLPKKRSNKKKGTFSGIEVEPDLPASSPKKKPIKKKGNLQCTECDRTFVHRNSLVYHMRSHTGIRPHQCDQCGKSFFASSALKVHLRLHSGDKPYTCSECGKKFRQWGDLKYHLTSIHSNEKNFQCEYCGKEFARKYSLIVHRRIHTGEKNYKCEFCGKTFRASSYLQNHRRIHTGEKPHSCDICMKPFRVRSDMKRHMKTHQKPHQPPHAAAKITAQQIHMAVQAKVEQSDEDDTAELQIGTEEDDPATQQILAEYEADPLDGTTRELGTVRMGNRNLYINGNELFLVTYPSEMQH